MRQRLISGARSWIALLLLFSLPQSIQSQVSGPTTGGIVALQQSMVYLGHHQRVLLIGAHPDDEDTELLALLARGYGAEASYLALNRGEGGQNLIGSELGEGLGLLRTGELLAARQLDGARQFFTRAYDFGYSKTLEDTWAHWPRDSVLKDVVRVVRRFRPQIIVSIFSGTPRDGHGQHQAAGWAAQEAYRLAGDERAFPELGIEEGLQAWTPSKLYRSTRFDRGATSLRLAGGVLDPITGQSFHQIAMRSRSLHRSQDMGVLQTTGPSTISLHLIDNRTPSDSNLFFAGVDTTLSGLPSVGRSGLAAIQLWQGLERDLQEAQPTAPEFLALRKRLLDAWPRDPAGARVEEPALTDQLRHLNRALEAVSGVVCDARSADPVAIPGVEWQLLLSCWNASSRAIQVSMSVHLRGQAEPIPGPNRNLAPGVEQVDTVRVILPETMEFSTPYFMRLDRSTNGGFYRWPPGSRESFGRPSSSPLATARFEVGQGPVLLREINSRTRDQAFGEVRAPVPVVPRVSVALDPTTVVFAVGTGTRHRFRVTVQAWGTDTIAGQIGLDLPVGWPTPPAQSYRLTHRGERHTFSFDVQPPVGAPSAQYQIRAVVTGSEGERFDRTVQRVAYPHIAPTWYTTPASALVALAEVTFPQGRRIGYIRGAADRIPESLVSLGISVDVLDGEALERADLNAYDVIVIGPRAYETDSILVANSDRLLDYARSGGVLLVQYQQYGYFRNGYAPFPMTIRVPHNRVADETATVEMLVPDSPILQGPNRINAGDWEHWIQERGLYFPQTWDSAYTALLRMADPAEALQDGALLTAPLGQGTFVYTGLSFFRQLPAGVPGAVRLFLNLLALEQRRVVP